MVEQKEKPITKSIDVIWDAVLPILERYTNCDGYELSQNNETSMEELFQGNRETFRKALLEIAEKLGVTLSIIPGTEFKKCNIFMNVTYYFYMKMYENQDMWDALLQKYGGNDRYMESKTPLLSISEKKKE